MCLYMCVYPWVLEGWHLTQMSITNPCPTSRPFVQDVCPIPLFLTVTIISNHLRLVLGSALSDLDKFYLNI